MSEEQQVHMSSAEFKARMTEEPAALSVTATEKAPSRKITEEDRLTVENLYLRIENLALQKKLLQADLTRADELIREAQQKLVAKSADLQERYGFVLGRDQVGSDGTIIQVGK